MSDTEKKNNNSKVHFIVVLRNMLSRHKDGVISFGEIMNALKEEGLIFLIAIIALPTSIPIPTPPGFTTLFGIPLCVLTAQMVYKLGAPWLPSWLEKRTIKVETLKLIIDKSEPVFLMLSRFLRPRYSKFTTSHFERIVGFLAFLCSMSIALPILFGNAIPSAGILIMALGLLYQDGLMVLIGMAVSILGLVIAGTVVVLISFLGMEFLHKLVHSSIGSKFL
jgi:hypothetical protein